MNDLFKMNDRTAEFNETEAKSGKGLGIISYLGILSLISYFAEKNNQWVRFHAIQGLNLLIATAIAYVGLNILTSILAIIPYLGIVLAYIVIAARYILNVFTLVLTIMGIVYAAQGKAIELPVIKNIKIIKK